MNKKPWRPMLYPNEQVSTEDMSFPLYASHKLDGIRTLFVDGEMLTRSGKPVPNEQLHQKYADLKKKSKTLGVVLDGELYQHGVDFGAIQSVHQSHDKEVPDDYEFWLFDYIFPENTNIPFRRRQEYVLQFAKNHNIPVPDMYKVNNPEEVESTAKMAYEEGYEGLILNNPDAPYKNGRITVPSGNGYKIKPYRTFDSKIIGVVQATEVDPDAEKTINELGYSETSNKKDDRIPVEKAAAFEVWYCDAEMHFQTDPCACGQKLKVTIAATDEEKEEIWRNREDYIGKTVEYKGMLHGAKDLPRHPVHTKIRYDK